MSEVIATPVPAPAPPVRQAKYIVISMDLEATGLKIHAPPEKRDQITEIGAAGAVIYEDSTDDALVFDLFSKPFNQLTKTDRVISAKVQHLTKINQQVLQEKKAIDLGPAFALFAQYITDVCNPFPPSVPRVLIAHNGKKFDIPMFVAELERCSIPASKYMQRLRFTYLLDSLLLSRDVVDRTLLPRDEQGLPSFGLGDIYKSICKRPLEGYHGALADCTAVLHLLLNYSCFWKPFLHDLTLSEPKYSCNLMKLVDESIPKKTAPKDTTSKSAKRVRTIDQFFHA